MADWAYTGLPTATQQELAALSAAHGVPQQLVVRLGSASGSFGPRIRERTLKTAGLFAPIGKADRFGEVCMVVRRKDGRLITARKSYYPPNAFRLLTGGIHHGESIHTALLREVAEETSLEVAVRRFLAAITYLPADSAVAPFHTFAFLLDELGGELAVQDLEEDVAAFGFPLPDELPALAAELEALGEEQSADIAGLWSDWGRFRAVVHHVVHETLANEIS